MKDLALLLSLFVVGQCVQITRSVFKGQYWTVIAVNDSGTYDLKDRDWILRDVRASYLVAAEEYRCWRGK